MSWAAVPQKCPYGICDNYIRNQVNPPSPLPCLRPSP